MKDLQDESFDTVLTDPPYGIDFQSGHRTLTPQFKKIANDKRPFIWWLFDAYRVTVDGGHLLCFCRWDVQDAFKTAIEWAGYTIKGQLIWNRENHGSGDLQGGFAPQHDVIWHAVKQEQVKAQIYGKRPVSVIPVMRLSGGNLRHPNEKPVDLLRYLVRATTLPGGRVLDPFAGTGSTGKACQLELRSFTGIEIDPYYADMGNKDLSTTQLTMDFGEILYDPPTPEPTPTTKETQEKADEFWKFVEVERKRTEAATPLIIDDGPHEMTPGDWKALFKMKLDTHPAEVSTQIYQDTMLSAPTERKEELRNEVPTTVEPQASYAELAGNFAYDSDFDADADFSEAMAAIDADD